MKQRGGRRGAVLVVALALLAFVGFEALRGCWVLVPGSVNPGLLSRPEFQRGVNLVSWAPGELRAPEADAVLRSLPSRGITWVNIVPTWYQAAVDSISLEPLDGPGSISLAEIAHATRVAREAGLKVSLKPHIDARDGTWRGEFRPGGPNMPLELARAWLAGYRTRLLSLAELATRERVDQLVLGTELVHLSTDPRLERDWRSLIDQVRQRYGGRLTYAANWGREDGEYRRVPWWDALDAIGVDAYFPLSSSPDPSEAELVQGWREYREPGRNAPDRWLADLAALHERTGKPILFTEVGFPSHADAASRPWDYESGAHLDVWLQERAYAATLQALSGELWLHGLYWWALRPNLSDGGPRDRGHTIQGKPALATLERWYRTAGSDCGLQHLAHLFGAAYHTGAPWA